MGFLNHYQIFGCAATFVGQKPRFWGSIKEQTSQANPCTLSTQTTGSLTGLALGLQPIVLCILASPFFSTQKPEAP